MPIVLNEAVIWYAIKCSVSAGLGCGIYESHAGVYFTNIFASQLQYRYSD